MQEQQQKKELQQLQKAFDLRCTPLFSQFLELTHEKAINILTTPRELDPRDCVIYRGIRNFAKTHQIGFYVCAIQAMDLYYRKIVSEKDVEEHLAKKFETNLENPPNLDDSFVKAYKTILIVGRTGEGKSLTVNHLVGKDVAKIGGARSATVGTNLYVSDRCRLNIIDTEGLDGTHTKETNQQLMENIRHQALFYLEFDASIDAILIMWCPIKNGRSGLAKTIRSLQESFGDDIAKSCIVVIQGNWVPLAEILDLTHAVPEGIQEIQTTFPQMPIAEYDAKGTYDAEKFSNFYQNIEKVKPYQPEFFQEKGKILFFQMAQAFKARLKHLEKAGTIPLRGAESFYERFKENMFESLNNREQIMSQKNQVAEEVVNEWMKIGKRIHASVLLKSAIVTATAVLPYGGVILISAALYGFFQTTVWADDKKTKESAKFDNTDLHEELEKSFS